MNGQRYPNTPLSFLFPSANRHHGLVNQGSTCYLNSVLQVLFMTKDFREAVTSYSGETLEFLDHDLKVLFDDLSNHTASTKKITQKLGIHNVYEQRDAAEYFERVLRMTSPASSQIFHGQLANKTTCSVGHIQTDRDAPFWHLPLSLVDSCSEDYSVVKGIEEFFKPSDFCGENQMYCEQCDDKVDGTMRDVINHHPDVLCLLLKRFEFSYNYMSYIKINCSVDVPDTLQIPESQTYELYAVVDHVGDLRGGHYSATIKIEEEREDRWYQFDDTRVAELHYQPFQLDITERSKTAYLLFYRKKKADTGVQDSTDVSTSGSFPLTINNEYDQSHDGKNKRKREEDACSEEAEGSPDAPCIVDPLDNEPNEDNGATGSDDPDQKHTGADDVKRIRPDNNTDLKPKVSDTSAVCDDLNVQNEMSKLMDDKSDKDEKAKNKQSEKKSHAEHPADTVGENKCEHQQNKQNSENYYSCSPSYAEEEKTKTYFQHDTTGKISADKPTVEMCCDTFQDIETVDDRGENTLKDDQGHKHGNRHSDHSDALNMQQISVTHSSDNNVCVEREISDIRQDRTEIKGDNKGDHSKFGQNTAGEVSGAAKTQKDVAVEEEMKVKEYEGNTEQTQIRQKSYVRPAGAEIIEAPKENQDAGTNENARAESCEPKVRPEIKEITGGGRGSQKSGKVQETYVEKQQKSDGESFGTKMKDTEIETVEKTSQGSSERRVRKNEGNSENKSHTKNAIKPRGVILNDASLPEQQKRRSKREEHKHHDTNYEVYTRSHELDNVEIEAAGSEYGEANVTCGCFTSGNKTQRQLRKEGENKKPKKTAGFFSRFKNRKSQTKKSGKVQETYVEKQQKSDGESFGTKMKDTEIETVEKTSQGSSERRVRNNEGNTENKSAAGSEYGEANETSGCFPSGNKKQRQLRKEGENKKSEKTAGFFSRFRNKLKKSDQDLKSD